MQRFDIDKEFVNRTEWRVEFDTEKKLYFCRNWKGNRISEYFTTERDANAALGFYLKKAEKVPTPRNKQ